MAINVFDPEQMYRELSAHVGHDITCVSYADGANVAVECNTCNLVLMDADRYPEETTIDDINDVISFLREMHDELDKNEDADFRWLCDNKDMLRKVIDIIEDWQQGHTSTKMKKTFTVIVETTDELPKRYPNYRYNYATPEEFIRARMQEIVHLGEYGYTITYTENN